MDEPRRITTTTNCLNATTPRNLVALVMSPVVTVRNFDCETKESLLCFFSHVCGFVDGMADHLTAAALDDLLLLLLLLGVGECQSLS